MKRDHKIKAAGVHSHTDQSDCPDGYWCDHAVCVCGRQLRFVDFWHKAGDKRTVTAFYRHAPEPSR